MAHDDIFYLIEKTLETKEEKKEKILKELYELVDEYNGFIELMDKKFDNVVVKMEALIEDGH